MYAWQPLVGLVGKIERCACCRPPVRIVVLVVLLVVAAVAFALRQQIADVHGYFFPVGIVADATKRTSAPAPEGLGRRRLGAAARRPRLPGAGIDPLQGWYLFGDFCGGWLRAVPSADPGAAPVELVSGYGPVLSLAEMEYGELLVLGQDGIHAVAAPG